LASAASSARARASRGACELGLESWQLGGERCEAAAESKGVGARGGEAGVARLELRQQRLLDALRHLLVRAQRLQLALGGRQPPFGVAQRLRAHVALHEVLLRMLVARGLQAEPLLEQRPDRLLLLGRARRRAAGAVRGEPPSVERPGLCGAHLRGQRVPGVAPERRAGRALPVPHPAHLLCARAARHPT